jgi:hypothetical protein
LCSSAHGIRGINRELSRIVHDICISIVDDFECVAGALDEGGGWRPEVGAGVLDACCFIILVSTSYLPSKEQEGWGNGERRGIKGMRGGKVMEGEQTSNRSNSSKMGWISLSQHQGYSISGPSRRRPSDIERCACSDGAKCCEGEGILS